MRECFQDDVVLTEEQICIADFGLCAVLKPPFTITAKLACGTKVYHTPEQLQDQEYDSSVDMYAVAIVTFILLLGKHPFLNREGKWDVEKQKLSDWSFLETTAISE